MRQGLLELESNRPAPTFYALCLLIAWPFVLLHTLNLANRLGNVSEGVTLALLVGFAQFSPSLSAFILVANRHGGRGVRRLLRRAVRVPAARRWLGIAALLPLGIVALTVLVMLLVGLPRPDFAALSGALVAPYYLLSLLVGLVFGGLSEEFGWRGYLLPVLQRRHSALVAGVVTGLLWALWHLDPETMLLPLFGGGRGAFLNALAAGYGLRMISDVATAVIMVWLFNSTGGSLLVAVLFHSSVNAAQTVTLALWSDFPLAGELIYYGVGWGVVLLLVLKLGTSTLSADGIKQVLGAGFERLEPRPNPTGSKSDTL